MFKKVSYRIALQFTAFVFVLFLINGTIFLIADIDNARRQTHSHLAQTLNVILSRVRFGTDIPPSLAPLLRERVRIVDADGNLLFSGSAFENVRFSAKPGISYAMVEDERYAILTSPITAEGRLVGHIQIAQVDRLHYGDLPYRAFIYLLVSGGVTALTFFAGLFFARRSLKPAEQMVERLEQFTQDASHELRTPLATLNSSLDLALKTRDYREGLLSAKEDVRQISTVVERLLELARLDKFALKPEKIDLSALAEEAIDRHMPFAAEKSVKIERDIAPGIHVAGDSALLRQVMGNLLSNAIKFRKPEGGSISVTLSKSCLSIADTGIGIAQDALPHVFDRFYQVDPSRSCGGLGLGLALVKRIVDLHGWTIGVKSEEGRGTTFKIVFTS